MGVFASTRLDKWQDPEYAYDGNGGDGYIARVKLIAPSDTIVYIGKYLEKTSTNEKIYYYEGGARVAMRTAGTLYYLLTDQLGSSTAALKADGTENGKLLYSPWGEVRYTTGSVPTSFRYTGQIEYATIAGGIMHYGARWYDNSLGRWLSPDSIIPAGQGVQAYDRFAYVNNSPVNFTDPTGHTACWDEHANDPGCGGYTPTASGLEPTAPPLPPPYFETYPQNPTTTIGPADNSNTLHPIQGNSDDFTGFWELNRLDAIGVRGDASGWLPIFPFFGGDITVDIVVNFSDVSIDLYFTPSLMVGLGEGASLSGGLVGYYDTPKAEDGAGFGLGGQVTIAAPPGGAQLSYGYSAMSGTYGQNSQTWGLTYAAGANISVNGSGGYSFWLPIYDFDD